MAASRKNIPEENIIAKEKIDQATKLLKEKDIDLWLILTREGTDPCMDLMVGIHSVHEGAIFLRKDGHHIVLTSKNDKGNYEATGLFEEVFDYGKDVKELLIKTVKELNPNKIALNVSKTDALCDGLTLGQYMLLENCLGRDYLAAREISSEEMLKELRSIKTATELERLEIAIDMTCDVYDVVFAKLRAGMSENDVGRIFIDEMKKRGVVNGIGFDLSPPIACCVRHGLAHRGPSDEPILPGDVLVMDFSLCYKGYVSDIARTAYFLKPGETQAPEDVLHAFNTAVTAVSEVIDFIAAGKCGYEVDAVGRSRVEKNGFPTIRHSTGHQIGRACHDGGTILGPRRQTPRPEVETRVKVGELYAIEPTVIQDGGLPSIIVEENVVITEAGAKVLSRRQTEIHLVKP